MRLENLKPNATSRPNLGNRQTSNRTGVPSLADDYTTNNLNQYTARENNTLVVAGTVASSAVNVVVTPSGGTPQAAGRAGGFWGTEVAPANASGPVQQSVTVVGALSSSGASASVSSESVSTAVPAASEAYTYDHDGNPLTDALWSYTWDAENRLIAMESTSAAIAGSITKQKLEFAYDYLHRRVQKKTYTWSGSAWTLATHRKFLYEGWNVIREDELLTAKVKTLAWGLDLVGSLSQSGGVGALLALHDTATNEAYLPGYDGNGNVAVMVDVATGTLKATYEYSPFGQFLRKEGSYAEANPIRFSTKYTDEETDLVYYGRRYYDPKDGRFVGRDPLQEAGGMNLYAFVSNNPADRWDYLGMSWLSKLLIYADEAFRGNDNQTDLRSPGEGYGTWSETGVFGPGYYNEDTDVRDIPGFDAAGHDQMKQIIADVNGSQSSFGSSFGGGGAAGYGGLTIPNAPNSAVTQSGAIGSVRSRVRANELATRNGKPDPHPNLRHRNRNSNNIIPSSPPVLNGNGEYVDSKARVWVKDDFTPYHGRDEGNRVFRGTDDYSGSEAVYTPDGIPIDSGPNMGTYNYSNPFNDDGTINVLGAIKHYFEDVAPHDADPHYPPNQSTID